MPELTVRSLAEFIGKPIADQMRILAAQKRPQAEPATYRVNYYQKSRQTIRRFFANGNDHAVIHAAISDLHGCSRQPHYIDNNVRAIETFVDHQVAARALSPQAFSTQRATVHGVDIKVTPDLFAVEGNSPKYIFFNFTVAAMDDDEARRTLELANWAMQLCGFQTRPGDFEFLDLQTGIVHLNPRQPRQRTVNAAIQNAQVINQLWPII